MGHIIKKWNTKFDELIVGEKFDKVFKNLLRDYFTYGFKSKDEFSVKPRMLQDRWTIFCRIFSAEWEFIEEKRGRNQIVLKTVDRGAESPIDDLYFLHHLSTVGNDLNYLLDLDENVVFRKGALPEQLEKDSVKMNNTNNTVEDAIIRNWTTHLYEKEDFPVRKNIQLNIWSPDNRHINSGDRYKALTGRLRHLQKLGILGNLKYDPQKRNEWLKNQWELTYKNDNRSFHSELQREDYWYKSKLTLTSLAECETEERRKSFFQNFQNMCEFFSQYYPLGVIGVILARRCAELTDMDSGQLFKFKHNYFQKSLYDYNLIDLWTAIERENYCYIRYCHGVNQRTYEAVIIPLEIRVSVVNGREYVLYYDIRDQKIKTLRLEFIDNITVYAGVQAITCQKCVKNDSEEETTDLWTVEIHEDDVKEQLATARQMLPYIWGVETCSCAVRKDWQTQLRTYMMSLDQNEPYYIRQRLEKEKRKVSSQIGHIEKIECFPTKELRTRFRSYYVRLNGTYGIDEQGFSVGTDVSDMWNIYYGKKNFVSDEVPEKNKKATTAEYKLIVKKGKRVAATEGHGALFNQYFSIYTIILGNTVLKCAADKRLNFDQVLREELKENLSYANKETVKYLLEEAVENNLIVQQEDRYVTRFVADKTGYLSSLLPLTKVEARWLLTILEEPLAEVFLSKECIKQLKQFCKAHMPCKISPFLMSAINYYDRYQKKRGVTNEVKNLQILYEAMKSEKRVKITYRNQKGEKRTVWCSPAWLEYSKKDDQFRVYYVNDKIEKTMKIVVSRIINIEIDEQRNYDIEEQQETIKRFLESEILYLQIEFYEGNRNLPDRILTEFSLWKKTCVYDVNSGLFTMTLYYPKDDEKEILIRLLGYGPYVKIVQSDGNYIYEELKNRISTQKYIELIQLRPEDIYEQVEVYENER